MPLEANTTISHYKILHSLGAGGMGEVYLAEDGRLRRKVALKVLPDTLAQDTERLRRFEQEALAASALNHPNILTIFEFGEEGGTHYLASEFIDGETLRERLRGGPLELNETLDIVIQTVQALAAAHEAGIIHRDIKPENVMLRKDGIVKVLDFGLAKLVETTPTGSEEDTRKQGMTRDGMVMGTVAYMSPEQARGKVVDARTDQFSLGVMLYEMLSRHQPFTGETFNHVIVAILEKEPTPLAGIPSELKRILEKALAKNAADRYSDAKAMLGELKKLQTRLLVEAETGGNREEAVANTLIEGRTAIMSPSTVSTSDVVAAAGSQPKSADTPKQVKWWVAAALSLLLAVGGFFGLRYFTPPSNQINSIAVLPFENRNGNADSEYLSDGLAESLIYRLSQLPNLKVSPTSSVFRYKGKGTDPQLVAKELGVDSVMTGRVTQRGDNLTISVNLVDTRNGKSLWGEQYERKMSELLNTQREIASEITNKLQLKLSGAGEQKLTKKYTDSNEAYQLYLKGRYLFARRTKDDVFKAVEYYNQAIKLDPNFALAYARIAEAYNQMPNYPYLSPNEAIPLAKAAARRALEIDPMLSEAHSALANSITVYDRNWAEAESEFKRALELDPNNALAHYRYAMEYLVVVGRNDEALAEVNRALEIEPLDINMVSNMARVNLYNKNFDKALEQARKANEIDPSFIVGKMILGMSYNQNGLYEDTLRLSKPDLQADPSNQFMLQVAGVAYAKSNRRKEAELVIERFREIKKTQYVVSYFVALIYAALGERDKAFAELLNSYEQHDGWLRWIKVDPHLDSLHDDPRFKDLLKRMGLAEGFRER